jgi:hypothetical protein
MSQKLWNGTPVNRVNRADLPTNGIGFSIKGVVQLWNNLSGIALVKKQQRRPFSRAPLKVD